MANDFFYFPFFSPEASKIGDDENEYRRSDKMEKNAAYYDKNVIIRSPWTGELELPHVGENKQEKSPATDRKSDKTKRHLWAAVFGTLAFMGISMGTMAFVDIRDEAISITKTPSRTPGKTAGKQLLPASDREINRDKEIPHVPKKTKLSYEDNLQVALSLSTVQDRIAGLRKIISEYPNRAEALANLAWLLMDASTSRQEALKLAKKAISLKQANSLSWLVLGHIHHLSGELINAMDAYEKCTIGDGSAKIKSLCGERLR